MRSFLAIAGTAILFVVTFGLANAGKVEVEVKDVVVDKSEPGFAKYTTDDGVTWHDIKGGQVLKTCDSIKLYIAGISVLRKVPAPPCPNRQKMVHRWKDDWDKPLVIHISETNVDKDGSLPGGYIDVSNGDVRTVDGPGCEGTGHCGKRTSQAEAVATDDGVGIITDWRCVQDSVNQTTAFYNHPLSTGSLGTRALVGSDTITIHTLAPGEAIRYDNNGETTVPHVGMFAEPFCTYATVDSGSLYQFQEHVFNPDSGYHTISINLVLEDSAGWNAYLNTYEVSIAPGQDTVISVFVEAPLFPEREVNIVHVLASSESGDEYITSFYLKISSDIPTLTEWGMIIFCVLLFGWMAWVIVRRRRRVTVGI